MNQELIADLIIIFLLWTILYELHKIRIKIESS